MLISEAYSWEEELKEEWGRTGTGWHLSTILSAGKALQSVAAASLLPPRPYTGSSSGPALTWNHPGNRIEFPANWG